MNRRTYLSVVASGITGSIAGCAVRTDRTAPRPLGAVTHRDNIAMTVEEVQVMDTLEGRGERAEPSSGDGFALVRFWAENLVDSRRYLPDVSPMILTLDGTDYAYESAEAFDVLERRYTGGPVEPGVLRHGYVPFEIDDASVTEPVTFRIPPEAGEFSDAVSWSSPS